MLARQGRTALARRGFDVPSRPRRLDLAGFDDMTFSPIELLTVPTRAQSACERVPICPAAQHLCMQCMSGLASHNITRFRAGCPSVGQAWRKPAARHRWPPRSIARAARARSRTRAGQPPDGRRRRCARLPARRRHTLLVGSDALCAADVAALAMLGYYGADHVRASRRQIRRRAARGHPHIRATICAMAAPTMPATARTARTAVRARTAETGLRRHEIVVKLDAIEGEIIQAQRHAHRPRRPRAACTTARRTARTARQIDMRSTDGMTAKLTSAIVFTKENRIVSNEPVDGRRCRRAACARDEMELKTQAAARDVHRRRRRPHDPQQQQKPATASGRDTAKGVGKPKKDKAAAARSGRASAPASRST